MLAVEIPKPHGGGTRILGVPTIADRVAQTVVARRLEAKVEPIFHPDSYGYRPDRSALDAVAACRERCWKSDWVIDLDIQKFFDSVPWDLMVKAVEAHTDLPWVVLYVKRWLRAPLALPDGTLQQRDRGTPQGSAVSPVLANLFMHYAFDAWMAREYPNIRFERYADDVVVHCVTERQARTLVAAIGDRMEQVGLRLHPDKTRIVVRHEGASNEWLHRLEGVQHDDDVARVSAHDLSPPRHALPVTAGCEARGKAQGSLPHRGDHRRGEGRAGEEHEPSMTPRQGKPRPMGSAPGSRDTAAAMWQAASGRTQPFASGTAVPGV